MASNEKDSPISLLETLSEIDGNLEYFAVAKDGTTYKCTPAQLKDFVLKGETPVVRIPLAVLNLSNSSSSEDILNAFGGKDAYNGYVSKITQKSVIKIGDALYAVSQVLGSSYTDENNSQLVVQTIAMNLIKYIQVTVTGGTAKAIVGKWDVVDAAKILTKDNTTAYTPTQNYHPATKKYADNIGYGKVIDVADGSLLTINKNIWSTEAYDHVVKIFGSTDVIKNMIIDICNNHTKYYIHSYSSYRNCIELSSVYTYYTDEERYEIEFNISYYTSQGPVFKRIAIVLNLFDDDKSDDRLFIEDILVSDNLQRAEI